MAESTHPTPDNPERPTIDYIRALATMIDSQLPASDSTDVQTTTLYYLGFKQNPVIITHDPESDERTMLTTIARTGMFANGDDGVTSEQKVLITPNGKLIELFEDTEPRDDDDANQLAYASLNVLQMSTTRPRNKLGRAALILRALKPVEA